MRLTSKLRPSNTHDVADAMRDAAIAFYMGNVQWREVFRRHSYRHTSPALKKMLIALADGCSERHLEDI